MPVPNVPSSLIPITVQTSTLQLPSEGLLYPEDSPVANGHIDFHIMTAREEDILSSKSLLRQGLALDALLKSCITTSNVDPLSLLTCDRNALFLAIRISGFGANYSTRVMCPACQSTNVIAFDLSKLEYNKLTIDPIEPRTNLFYFESTHTIHVPNGFKVKFKLTTGYDEKEISEIGEKNQMLHQRAQESQNKIGIAVTAISEHEVTLRMKKMITEIEGYSPQQYSTVIDSLPAIVSREFRKYISTIEPGIIMKQDMACASCGTRTEVDIPITTDFFWPATDI